MSSTDFSIRPFVDADWEHLWPILQATFVTGDTYAFAPDSSEASIRQAWIELPQVTMVAVDAGNRLLGTYFLKPNQPGLGQHVCNCGYVVAAAAQGRGVASALCQHSQQTAVQLGFLAMQFNLVVATNLRALRLWEKHGFSIIGTLTKAFRHQQLGLVDAHVMYKLLSQP